MNIKIRKNVTRAGKNRDACRVTRDGKKRIFYKGILSYHKSHLRLEWKRKIKPKEY
jgi:hypothetical protein